MCLTTSLKAPFQTHFRITVAIFFSDQPIDAAAGCLEFSIFGSCPSLNRTDQRFSPPFTCTVLTGSPILFAQPSFSKRTALVSGPDCVRVQANQCQVIHSAVRSAHVRNSNNYNGLKSVAILYSTGRNNESEFRKGPAQARRAGAANHRRSHRNSGNKFIEGSWWR